MPTSQNSMKGSTWSTSSWKHNLKICYSQMRTSPSKVQDTSNDCAIRKRGGPQSRPASLCLSSPLSCPRGPLPQRLEEVMFASTSPPRRILSFARPLFPAISPRRVRAGKRWDTLRHPGASARCPSCSIGHSSSGCRRGYTRRGRTSAAYRCYWLGRHGS